MDRRLQCKVLNYKIFRKKKIEENLHYLGLGLVLTLKTQAIKGKTDKLHFNQTFKKFLLWKTLLGWKDKLWTGRNIFKSTKDKYVVQIKKTLTIQQLKKKIQLENG